MNLTNDQRAELQARLELLQHEQKREVEETNAQVQAAHQRIQQLQQELLQFKQQAERSIIQRAGRIEMVQELLGNGS